MNRPDLLIVGAGLSGGLLAYRLAQARPELSVLVVDGGEPGGNHTWSFHEDDLDVREERWIEPLIEHRWPAYEVRFPGRRRRLATGYRSVSSERFRDVLGKRLGSSLQTGRWAVSVEPNRVVFADGDAIEAGAVIDARGPRATPHLSLGFQKFLGQELEFERPHGLAEPIVMDATVEQDDGYRFVYCLPFSPTRMLIEDTYYADGEGLPRDILRERIASYASDSGWGAYRVVREEDGILPIALGGDIDAHLADLRGVPTVGLAAALFHPTTGYSLADAVCTADFVAGLSLLSAPDLSRALADHSRNVWADRAFFRGLNRMLFKAGEPSERYRVLEHFHRLPDDLIARFYASRLTMLDKGRILVGKPSVPVASALRALLQGR